MEKCKLEQLFEMQASLNDNVFLKQGITDNNGETLTNKKLYESGLKNSHGPNSLTNEWLKKYLEALNDESRELSEELLRKWWSKDKLDMQNIRVEIIDLLHFLISLSLAAGMDAESVFQIYWQKNKVNFERQKNNYSKETKNEADNRGILFL